MLKKLVSFFLAFCSVFFFITFGKHSVGFIKSNTLSIKSENISKISVEEDAKGFSIFAGVPVYSRAAGRIAFKVQPGSFVEKGAIVGILMNGESQNLIDSPASGIFLNYSLSKYENKIDDVLLDPNNEPNLVKDRSYVESNGIIGSVITDNNFYVCLKGIKVGDSKKYLTFLLSDGISETIGTVVRIDGDYTFVLLKDYINYFLGKSEFRVITNALKGIIVDNKNIVKKNGKNGILIVNGNRISFFETKFIPIDKSHSAAEVNNYGSLLVVEKGHFLAENEIIGGF